MDNSNATTTPPQSLYSTTTPEQQLWSLGLQFVLCCCIGGAGGVYCLRSLRKVRASEKVLRKYTAIPNLLVASLITCCVVIPLRMFATVVLLTGDDVFTFCLVIVYVETTCDLVAAGSVVVLAVQRLRGVLRHRFAAPAIVPRYDAEVRTRSRSQRRRRRHRTRAVLVVLLWLGSMVVGGLSVWVSVVGKVSPRGVSSCTRQFSVAYNNYDGDYNNYDNWNDDYKHLDNENDQDNNNDPHHPDNENNYDSNDDYYNNNKNANNSNFNNTYNDSLSSSYEKYSNHSHSINNRYNSGLRFLSPTGPALVVDYIVPLTATFTFVVLTVAYTIIVWQIRKKTCMIHPTPPRTGSNSSNASHHHPKNTSVLSRQRSTISSKSGKTVSWSSIATNGPRFSEILRMAREDRNSGCPSLLNNSTTRPVSNVTDIRNIVPRTRRLSTSAVLEMYAGLKMATTEKSRNLRRRASCQEMYRDRSSEWLDRDAPQGKCGNNPTSSPAIVPPTNNSTPIKRDPIRRRSSNLSLVQVSTIPEMRSEEDLISRAESRLNAVSISMGAPVPRKQLPPVTLPEKHGRKKRKKWSRTSSQKRRHQYASDGHQETVTSIDSEISQWSGEIVNRKSRFCLQRQNAVCDTNPQERGEEDAKEPQSVLQKSEQRPGRHQSFGPVKPLETRDSLDFIRHRKSNSLPITSIPSKPSSEMEDALSSPSSQHSFSSYASDVTSNRRAQSWDTGSQKTTSELEVYYLPNAKASNPKTPPKKAQSFDDITPVEEENPHAPRIRIIRPSTETINLGGPGGRRAPMLGQGGGWRKTWAPKTTMTTISSNSDSELGDSGGRGMSIAGTSMGGTRYSSDANSESNGPPSPCSRSDVSSVSGALWARRRSTFPRAPFLASRQFSLASIWSNLPRRHSSNHTSPPLGRNVQNLSASFVLRRSLLIVGTFLITNLPLCVFHFCLPWISPSVVVNIYPLLKLWQQAYMALSPYIYVFSNQKIHLELMKTDDAV